MRINEENYLSCKAGCIDGDKLYVIPRFFPTLLEYNLTDLSYRVVSWHVMPSRYRRYLVTGLFKKGNKIYISHERCRNIIEYDLLTDTYQEYGNYVDNEGEIQNWDLGVCGDKLYAFTPFVDDEIICFDMQNRQMTSFPYSYQNSLIHNEGEEKEYVHYHVAEGRIYSYPDGGKCLYSMAVGEHIVEAFTLQTGTEIEDVHYADGVFWIISKAGKSVSTWMPKQGILGEYTALSIPKMKDQYFRIYNVIGHEQRVLFTAPSGGMLSILDMGTGKEAGIDISPYCGKTTDYDAVYFGNSVVVGSRVLLLPFAVDCFLWMDLTNGEVEPVSCRLRDEDVKMSRYLLNKGNDVIQKEEPDFTLNDYLHVVLTM